MLLTLNNPNLLSINSLFLTKLIFGQKSKSNNFVFGQEDGHLLIWLNPLRFALSLSLLAPSQNLFISLSISKTINNYYSSSRRFQFHQLISCQYFHCKLISISSSIPSLSYIHMYMYRCMHILWLFGDSYCLRVNLSLSNLLVIVICRIYMY